MAKQVELVDVTREFAAGLEVPRAREGGFQRKLDQKRIPEMARVLGGGAFCPPITVAIVGGKKWVIDGQHRLAAWHAKQFPLKAHVQRMEADEAMQAFILLNREQKKIGLGHILNVSTDEYAVRVRRLAADCKVTNGHIHNLMMGVTDKKDPLKAEVLDEHWNLAAKVMTTWMRNRRWGNEGSVFSQLGVLKLAGYYAGRAKTPGAVDAVLRDLQSLDYSLNGKIGRVMGTSWAQQAKMKAVFHAYLAGKILD